jgi:hypothetical protein
LDFAATMDRIKALWPAWGFGELLVEDKANGSAVISVLKRAAAGYAIDPEGLVKSDEEVAQAQQQALEQAQQGAAAAKDLAQADMGGDNALASMLRGVGVR